MTPEGPLLCPIYFPTVTSHLLTNLILLSHLHLVLGGGFFPSGFMSKHCMYFFSLPCLLHSQLNPLTPNDPYMSRTAPLTSKSFILYTYSTNVGTEYFKNALYTPFFFLFKMQFVS